MQLIDIGLNLTNKRFNEDRDQVIQEAIEAGITQMIVTGTNLNESKRAIQLSFDYPNVLYATAGCHPHDASSYSDEAHEKFSELSQHQSVVAIGECGLDFNRNFSSQAEQIHAFKKQLEIAIETRKPVFLHERDAFETQYNILKDYLPQLSRGVIHCFTGSQDALEKYLDLGLYIGITGWICDERRGQHLLETIKLIPDDKLMIETDAPYLTPRDLANKPKNGRNEPKYLPHIAQAVAKARSQTLETLADITYNNSKYFFNLSD
jgi:TatD DNase family protein